MTSPTISPTIQALAPTRASVRQRLQVRGLVQGVGFRPFVYRLARAHALAGFVQNDDRGVVIEIEGESEAVHAFAQALRIAPPPGAVIRAIDIDDVPTRREDDFVIIESARRDGGTVAVAPDRATCDDCWREFSDPADRRYRYPFINCTSCGPRFTIMQGVPYDRHATTMAAFTMCASCQAEYDDPSSRRFHAQPNACPACGPSQSWFATSILSEPSRTGHAARRVLGNAAVLAARVALQTGDVIAVKGIGGYHLMCDARSERAVSMLRTRKRRPDKPLAVMVASIDVARDVAHVSDAAARLLASPAHPIVLLPRRVDGSSRLASNLAPGVGTIGLLLPYAPIHALLAADGPVVCTSGNLSDEPIAYEDDDAIARLSPLVDGFLLHNRPIHVPCDDSVMQLDERDVEVPMRRSRGFAPFPVTLRTGLPNPPSVLAVGAELKSTLAITRGDAAYLSAHLGDVADPQTLAALSHAATHMQSLHGVVAERIACDLHPGYLSSRWARDTARAMGRPVIAVQHHHAHLAALMGEHALDPTQSILAFTFDGTGYGTDHTIWGGEVLMGNYTGFTRVASLAPFLLPGGDAAVREPARTALSVLQAVGLPWDESLEAVHRYTPAQRELVRALLERRIGCVETTSLGRFLDACAALLGVRQVVSHEGQAAIEMEQLALRAAHASDTHAAHAYAASFRFDLQVAPDGRLLMASRAVLERLLAAMRHGEDRSAIAFAVHVAIAEVMVRVAVDARDRLGAMPVGLTGGVFQNRLLSRLACDGLRAQGFTVLTHRLVPANDGGLALGQALIAMHATVEQTPDHLPGHMFHYRR